MRNGSKWTLALRWFGESQVSRYPHLPDLLHSLIILFIAPPPQTHPNTGGIGFEGGAAMVRLNAEQGHLSMCDQDQPADGPFRSVPSR